MLPTLREWFLRDGLGRRLIFWMVIVSTSLGVLASATQLYFAYLRDVTNTNQTIERFENNFHPSLVSALWNFNFNQTEIILDSLAASQDVAWIELTTTTGQHLNRGTDAEELVHRSIELVYAAEDGSVEPLGTLDIGITHENVRERLWAQFWTLFFTNMAKTTLASCAMLVVFQLLVARHLRLIAAAVRGMDMPLTGKVGLQRRTTKSQDDLDKVVDAINAAHERADRSFRAEQRLNRQLEDSNLELNRSNEELERFAYIAAHDLQEPLRKITAFGSLLVDEYGSSLDEEPREYVDYMVDAASRQQLLVKDLLTYSQIDAKSDDVELLDLTDVARSALNDLSSAVDETGATVDVALLPHIIGNRAQMNQVFVNLIGNALKYRHPDRAPEISISQDLSDPTIGPGQPSSTGRIIFRDNGIGFGQENAEEIFELFRRLHGRSAYDGTGIGLAIVKKIVNSHGGVVRAESEPGKGSTFIVNLPLAGGAERSAA